jgi:hypothetical protein
VIQVHEWEGWGLMRVESEGLTLEALPAIGGTMRLESQTREAADKLRLNHDGQSRAPLRAALLASGAISTIGRGRATMTTTIPSRNCDHEDDDDDG